MPGGGRLRLITSRDSERACAEVRFLDVGHGVPQEVVDRLFEPGFTTRAEAGGRGLGLDISRKIVRKMRGELELESTSEAGSTFLIRLPLAGEA
jgi:signal transduction histidine kinase